MRLIDADALLKDIISSAEMGGALGKVVECVKYYAKYMVASAPTIEPERKKGKWIVDGVRFKGGHDWMHCSECGRETLNTPIERTNYCPNCGARMEVEHDNNEDD